ncbi:aminotransferase class V-fold PLP-dependent enzyme [Paraburkholderia sp. D15]|uniref:aminotransferase class V-fold PLP-dependent enzyme n=1 Tax=Paraburkholderia sp. D15 TaxID=2880218 RepID=UPI0024785D24|nr:aminotransferase class V-fold PLP-dependent enzyme [Paraburkholderia sp. D15]WGS50466.1 aminotransferase class V-fold PLP-dependent enzyme [Paraburkholderia sp. D15]
MEKQLSRRAFINSSIGMTLAATSALSSTRSWAGAQPALPSPFAGDAAVNARNETYWGEIASQYDVTSDFINLENGYYGIMAKPVADEYRRNIEYLNEYSSYYLRRNYDATGNDAIRAQIAAAVGAAPEEIAITRGATEALQNLIVNYKLLKPGDTVMYADLDYDSTQYAMNFLKDRRGVDVAQIVIPEPATRQAILDTYAKAFVKYPKTRLLLLTHASHRTGLVMPIAEITKMAKAHHIDVIVDAAHTWGQIDFNASDLGADFIGFNLHKWIGAPLGVGFMYIRKDRLNDIDRQLCDEDYAPTDIRSRVHSGTTNTANVMTIPAALAFHNRVGVKNKGARLRYLRDYWVSRVRDFKGVQILTPDEPGAYGSITSFRLAGKTTKADNVAIVNRIFDRHKVFTTQRGGVAAGDCVRVTTSLFNRPSDLDQLVAALKDITNS